MSAFCPRQRCHWRICVSPSIITETGNADPASFKLTPYCGGDDYTQQILRRSRVRGREGATSPPELRHAERECNSRGVSPAHQCLKASRAGARSQELADYGL